MRTRELTRTHYSRANAAAHRFFPNLNRHDLQFCGFAILAIPVITGAFWIGIRNKRNANKTSRYTAGSRAGAHLPVSGER